jgi:hypothetical protein
MATGEAHTFIGTLLLDSGVRGLFMGCVWALKRMVQRTRRQTAVKRLMRIVYVAVILVATSLLIVSKRDRR